MNGRDTHDITRQYENKWILFRKLTENCSPFATLLGVPSGFGALGSGLLTGKSNTMLIIQE